MKRTSKALLSVVILLWLVDPCFSQRYVVKGDKGHLTVSGEKTYQLNEKIIIKASFESKNATYLWDTGDLSDKQTERVDSSLFIWVGKGTYTIRITAVDFDAKKIDNAKYTFTVGDAVDPVIPPVDPLSPVDATLLKTVKEAYTQEVQADKKAKTLTLSYAYKQAVLIAVDNEKITTVKMLNDILHDTIKVSMADTELALIRKGAISKWMKERFPAAPSSPLTPELRKQFKDAYSMIATALVKAAE